MPELEEAGSIFQGTFDRAFVKARRDGVTEGKREGMREGMRESLRRQALKKFGANGHGELPGLVAGLQNVGQLEEALDYFLECDDPEQFARFLQRISSGS